MTCAIETAADALAACGTCGDEFTPVVVNGIDESLTDSGEHACPACACGYCYGAHVGGEAHCPSRAPEDEPDPRDPRDDDGAFDIWRDRASLDRP